MVDVPETSNWFHQARGPQASLSRCQTCILEALFEINLAAAAGESGIAKGRNFRQNPITAPAINQRLRLDKGIKLVPSMV